MPSGLVVKNALNTRSHLLGVDAHAGVLHRNQNVAVACGRERIMS